MHTITPVRLALAGGLLTAAVVLGVGGDSPVPQVRASVAVDAGIPPARATRFQRGQFGGGSGVGQDLVLVPSYDKDADGRLNAAERRAAREYTDSIGFNRSRWQDGYDKVPAGPALAPADVRPYPSAPFYDTGTLRTLFFAFENGDWERELMSFRRTDVDVPATLTVDGRVYPDVGLQFHGNSSFSQVPMGFKHSMRVALDFVHDKQDVQSYNTLLLLNAHEDPTFLHTVLTLHIAREYIPAPRANLVRVVINGESWGVFPSQQQFNKDFLREWFKTTEGTRWKVPGTRGNAGAALAYLGEDVRSYKQVFEIKTKEDPSAWTALVRFARILNETPPDKLEQALEPMLDVNNTLKFLALENVVVNSDGYWSKGSDYSLYLDPGGRFHIIPYDVNTTFVAASRFGSVTLDPLEAMYDPSKPLASKLLAVPALRARYLGYVREIATKWLDWNTLGPVVARYHRLIDADVRTDARRLYSYEEFVAGPDTLRAFAERRRAFLLEVTAAP